jgi:hypothetical protein
LTQKHSYGSDFASTKANLSLISRNNFSQFWCGFCVTLHRMDEQSGQFLNERFTHIADHYISQEKHFHDWVDVETHKKKGALLQEMKDKAHAKEQDQRGGGADSGAEEHGSDDPEASSSSSSSMSLHHAKDSLRDIPSGSSGIPNTRHGSGKKRARPTEAKDGSTGRRNSKRAKNSPVPDIWECVSSLNATA